VLCHRHGGGVEPAEHERGSLGHAERRECDDRRRGAQELLGIQSSEPSEDERTTDGTSTEDTLNQEAEVGDSTDEMLEFDWESG
jgi:hypothetical protein